MTLEEQFRGAANVIRELGWCQGAYRSDTRVCLAQAVHIAATGRNDDALECGGYSPARPALDFLRDEVCADWSVESFNNCHCESADDAIAALEIAADLAS